MPLPATQPQPLTYADYLTWDDGQRWEIIDGEAFCMSPAPATEHQVIAGDVYAQLSFQLRGKRCQPFIAPLDVRLPKPGQDDATTDRVVQPDVLVVCDPAKYDHRGVRGAPDFVVEVLSRRGPRILAGPSRRPHHLCLHLAGRQLQQARDPLHGRADAHWRAGRSGH